jgi:hypothetical protein
MGNHYHFVLYTRQANLSLLMRHPLRHDHECGCPRAWVVDFPREPIDCSGGGGKGKA